MFFPDPDLVFNTGGTMLAVVAGANVYAYSFGSGGAETIATIGTYVAPTAGKCRFKLVGAQFYGAVNSLYEIQLADAIFANAGYGVDLFLTNGASDAHLQLQYQEPFIIAPVVGTATARTTSSPTISTYSGEDYLATVAGVDAEGNVIDWRNYGPVRFVVEGKTSTDRLVIEDASIVRTATYFQVTIPASVNVADRFYNWSIRIVAGNVVILSGGLRVSYAPIKD
jgi:hypothetical protein